MSDKEHIACCGDLCTQCPRYLATLKNDDNSLAETAELWYALGLRDTVLSNDEIRCSGCYPGKECAYEISNCKYLEGKNNCGECDFFPCDKISAVFANTQRQAILCRAKCSGETFEKFYRAFFMKEERLTAINTVRFKDPKP